MTNWVDHSVTITGPAAELDRFVACWVMPAKGERFPPYVEGKFDLDYDVSRPEGELFFSFDKLTPPKPDRCDRWVLSRWGFKYVAGQATIEVKDGAIKLSFTSGGYGSHFAIFEELAELFSTLVMVGTVYEPMMCYGGDIHVAAGKYTFASKSAEIEAEMEAWHKERRAGDESNDDWKTDTIAEDRSREARIKAVEEAAKQVRPREPRDEIPF
jgi:hypothetical protein